MPVPDFNVQAWLTRQLDWERDLERMRSGSEMKRRTRRATAAAAPPPPAHREGWWSRLAVRVATVASPKRGISVRRASVTIDR